MLRLLCAARWGMVFALAAFSILDDVAVAFAQSSREMQVTVAPMASGELRVQGSGDFRSGDSVAVRLYLVRDENRILKLAEQFNARHGGFEITLKPDKLPPGMYVVEILCGGQSKSVYISIEPFESVAHERGEQEKKLIGHWKSISRHVDKLVQLQTPRYGYTGTYYGWEKQALRIERQLARNKLKFVAAEQEKILTMLGKMIAICKLSRAAFSASDEHLEKYGLAVVMPDGKLASAESLRAECKDELQKTFKAGFLSTVRALLDKAEEGMQEVLAIQNKTKRLGSWDSIAARWRGLVEELVERHKQACERSLLYDADTEAVIDAVGRKMCAILPPCRALVEKKNEQAALEAKDARLNELEKLLDEFESGKKE